MKISEKQIMELMQVLSDSLKLSDEIEPVFFSFTARMRAEIYLEIMSQQSEELKDIE